MRRSVLIYALAVVAVIAGLVFLAPRGHEEQESPRVGAVVEKRTDDTIAHKWQWDNVNKARAQSAAGGNRNENEHASGSEMPYDAVSVYKVLQSIHVDENGSLVLDAAAMQALEKGYRELGELSPEAMANLQGLIRAGLPGTAGEEAAQVLENYYRYRAAEKELLQVREAQTALNGSRANQLPSIESYEELMKLRRSYLGKDVADRLFAVEDANARHMYEALAIQQNANLTAEEKQAQLAALQSRLNEHLVAIGHLDPAESAADQVLRLREMGASGTDIYSARKEILGADGARELAAADQEEAEWQRRFNGFWQARRYVMQAGLDDAERERQVDQLLEQYFSPEERDRARKTSADWQVRDGK
jgi:lipase chaperone LimK